MRKLPVTFTLGVSKGERMSTYKKMFSNYESEYLLQRRALGEELSDDAHKAIEEIFAERGEHLPPRPSKPILVSSTQKTSSKSGANARRIAGFCIAALALGTGKVLAHTWIGVVISLLIVGYMVIEWARKQSLTPEEQQEETRTKKAEEDNLSELMLAAAEGNLDRVKDLFAYGADVNAESTSGTTALMYAVRNNHVAVAQFLVSAKADLHRKSEKGTTALSLAKKYGSPELVSFLEQQGARA